MAGPAKAGHYRSQMTGRLRRVVFAASAFVMASVLGVIALFGLDLYLHKRAERSAGLNMWGYRGPAAARKQPGEIRVVVLGGSTAFGYGVLWDEAIPAQLERRLNEAGGPIRFSVVNLGYNNEGAFSFRYTLQDYAYLQPDIVCLYEGYNDLMGDDAGGNESIFRHRSPLFRATGYMPILPVYFREKAMALRSPGSLNDAYASGETTVFRPTLGRRATSGALEAAATVSDSLERQIARLGTDRPPVERATGSGCEFPWRHYCDSVAAGIDFALGNGQDVLFVTQPYLTAASTRDRHVSQQRAATTMLRQRYAANLAVRLVDLGDAVDLRDDRLVLDGVHLSPEGNLIVADRLEEAVRQAAARRSQTAR
jgi:lysophospholipase L1-like esterase